MKTFERTASCIKTGKGFVVAGGASTRCTNAQTGVMFEGSIVNKCRTLDIKEEQSWVKYKISILVVFCRSCLQALRAW